MIRSSLNSLFEQIVLFGVFIKTKIVIVFLVFCMQRVLEQRITALLDKLLVKPSLVNLPSVEEGGLLLVSTFKQLPSLALLPV